MPNIQFQFRRGTSSEWSSANPVLAAGEMGIETNTNLFKVGNGSTAWNALAYGGLVGATGAAGVAGANGATGATGSFSGTTSSAIVTTNVTASTSKTTGALVVAGGAGFSGNLYVNAIYTDNRYYANGAPFLGGGGGGGGAGYTNLDGGTPDSNFGGITGVDGGGVT
jgi:uncharacterized membrane protein YgdD (TMEM256/DUF423 family)